MQQMLSTLNRHLGFDVLPCATDAEISEVVDNLRPVDDAEVAAWGFESDDLRKYRHDDKNSPMWTVFHDGHPVFIVGLSRSHGDTYTLIGFGTPEVRKVMLSLSKWVQDDFLPTAFEIVRARRIEARLPIAADKNWRWLLSMGMKIETKLREFGARGEDFVQLSYTRQQYEEDFE